MKILIFGAGKFFCNRVNEFEKDQILGLIDNDSSLWGKTVNGFNVYSPNEINKYEYDYICIMMRKEYVGQVRRQLLDMNIPFSKVIDYFQYEDFKLPENERKKKILVWGTGMFYKNRKKIFVHTNVVAFIDSEIKKQGTDFEGKIIFSPEKINQISYDYICVMTNPLNREQIERQLQKLDIAENKIINYEQLMNILGIVCTNDINQEMNVKTFFENVEEPGIRLDRKLNYVEFAKPLITIITPYYNAGKYFEQTFNCIMNQTFPWFEWIIVNDGSTNKTDIDILNKMAQKDKRIRVINKENGGQADARNVGFSNAQTDIVVQLDADDLIKPQYIEYVYWGLYYNEDASWAYTWSTGFQGQLYLWRKKWNAELLKTQNYLISHAAIRKEAWSEIGGYKVEDILYNEDWRFWLEMLAAHKKPVCLGGYLSWYRRTDDGMLAGLDKDTERNRKSSEIINNVAQNVDSSIVAKEYPIVNSEKSFDKIQAIDWNEKYKIPKENGKRRMLIVLPWLVMGGADKFNVDVVAGLSNLGYEISIVTTVVSNNDWQYKFEKYTSEIYHLPEFLEGSQYISFVEYIIYSRQIDVLIVSNSNIGYHMLPYLRRKNSNLVIFDYVHMEEWYWRAGGFARTSALFRDILEKTYVCNSLTREVMTNYFGCEEEKVSTLYIGVDEQSFCAEKVEDNYLYKELNVSKERPIVLFPCRIHQQKRPFMMLEIAQRVSKKIPSVVFAVVGDGPQLVELQQKISSMNLHYNVKCIGRTDKMKECYKDAKLTLICSLKEGLALTAYESCSMGVPVISSDVGGQKDLIDDEVGKLIPTKQVEASSLDIREFDHGEVGLYVDAICELLTDSEKYENCSLHCRKRIENGFSVRNMIVRLNDEIEKLLNNAINMNKRKEMSEVLKKIPGLTEELYTLGSIVG